MNKILLILLLMTAIKWQGTAEITQFSTTDNNVINDSNFKYSCSVDNNIVNYNVYCDLNTNDTIQEVASSLTINDQELDKIMNDLQASEFDLKIHNKDNIVAYNYQYKINGDEREVIVSINK